jgi:dihydropteroate synthase
VPVIVMHWQKDRDRTIPLLDDMATYFARSIALAATAGISRDRIILDPGFGFGKTLIENYDLLRDLGKIRSESVQNPFSFPILVGTSRKSMIGKLLGNNPEERLAGTIATSVLGYINGGHIFRVHDVRENRDALRVAQTTLYGPPAGL